MTRSDNTEVARKRGTPESDTGRVGTIIEGRYRLEALIGRGGMGVVYRAAHLGLRKQVAIKVLHPSLTSSPEVRSRFEREALAIGKIEHPNCVGVLDVGTMDDGARYLVMELLDGKSLGDILDEEGQLAPTRALHILKHVLAGLGHVHLAELVHRDIKPENVYLVAHGEDRDFAKILDFGIAKPMKSSDLDDGVKLTQAGVAFGTPIYMSPEQAIGNPIDGRADLYSAAALGYEMLTGQPPFYSDDKLEVMSMHTTRPVPPMSLRLIKGGTPVSEAIEHVIAKGLAKRPEDRYQTAEEFISALNDLMEVGGATEVEIRPTRRITGSQPLAVSPSGVVTVEGRNAPVPSRPVALPGVAPLPGDEVPASSSTTGVLVRAPARVVAVSLPDLLKDAYEPPRRRSWWFYLVAASLATAIGIGVATLTLPRDKKLRTEGPVAAAAVANQSGNPAKALKILEKNRKTIETDPLGQLELGHARSALNQKLLAIEAYEKALTLAPELHSGNIVRGNIRAWTEDKAENAEGQEVVARAFALLMQYYEREDSEQRLLEATSNAEATWRRRHAALAVVEHHKLEDKLDHFAVYSLDLKQAEGCELRKAAIAKLRALGDLRAIDALKGIVAKYSEPAPATKRRGKGRAKARNRAAAARKKRGDYSCLVDDAESAITYLRELEAQQQAPAAPPSTARTP
ncbi:MAG: protein kinase [Kofleriaceae bacterium]